MEHGALERWGLLVLGLLVGGLAFCDLNGDFLRPGEVTRHGLRLGLSPAQVTERFDLASEGFFGAAAEDEHVLRWLPREVAVSSVREARFEFEGELLVAVRMRLALHHASAKGPAVEDGVTSLLFRRRQGDEVNLHWFLKGCQAHSREIQQLLLREAAAASARRGCVRRRDVLQSRWLQHHGMERRTTS